VKRKDDLERCSHCGDVLTMKERTAANTFGLCTICRGDEKERARIKADREGEGD
jgi:hypothetical protein